MSQSFFDLLRSFLKHIQNLFNFSVAMCRFLKHIAVSFNLFVSFWNRDVPLPKGEGRTLSVTPDGVPAPPRGELLCICRSALISSPFGGAGERSEPERVGSLPEGAGKTVRF